MNIHAHRLLVTLLAVVVALLFLQEPGFGDDLTYWSFAFDLHERGLPAWQRHSFHDLRWPVWGVCWLLQGVFGFGIASFYGVPILYLITGALLAWTFGRAIFQSPAGGWGCAIAFLFQPLLDSVCFRPMPDLSEGVLGAVIMLSWWALMHATSTLRAAMLAILTGLFVYVAESNRLTGIFIVPVLIVCTLLYFRPRFFWVVGAGFIAAICYGLEMWFYHGLFGDWLHNLHANLGGKGNKGTESIPVWTLPFRFFDTLWKGNPLAPVYCLLALPGLFSLWKRHGVLGRVIVLWFSILFLEYSCAPQSVWPWRPVIRDADRFLCGLVVPFSVLAVAGLWELGRFASRWSGRVPESLRTRRAGAQFFLGAAAVIALCAITSRNRFQVGFVPEFRDYMRGLPAGTKVFSHDSMRAIAFLCDASSAQRFTWDAPRTSILHRDPALEARAAQCDEFWYARKLVWLNTRKKLERRQLPAQPPLASYFNAPERDWTMTRLLAKGDTPDLIFYRRRTAQTPPPIILSADAREFGGMIPPLPLEWSSSGQTLFTAKWAVPPGLRGKLARFEVEAGSAQVEAFTTRLKFKRGRKLLSEYLLKPYLHVEGGKEFLALPIPAEAELCEVQLRFTRNAKAVTFTSFRAVFE